MHLTIDNQQLGFYQIPLTFHAPGVAGVFAGKNNKSVASTLRHRPYQKLAPVARAGYPAQLDLPLGHFLSNLKTAGDPFYRRFLNRYGDEVFCTFRLGESDIATRKGLYCFLVGEHVRYIGKTIDSFRKRINQGYGKIHPKNCYLDGQATNCRLNSLVAQNIDRVTFYACPISDDNEIDRLERLFIQTLRPEWNVVFSG